MTSLRIYLGYDDNIGVPFGRVDCKPTVLCSDFLRCQTLRQCSKESVQGSRVLRGWKKQDSRGGGEGVPTDLRGKLTESQLRKSKNLAKRRRQTNVTKFKAKKGSENRQNPAKATFGKKPLRERHFAKTCANDEDGSNTAPLPFSNLNFFVKNRHFFCE